MNKIEYMKRFHIEFPRAEKFRNMLAETGAQKHQPSVETDFKRIVRNGNFSPEFHHLI